MEDSKADTLFSWYKKKIKTHTVLPTAVERGSSWTFEFPVWLSLLHFCSWISLSWLTAILYNPPHLGGFFKTSHFVPLLRLYLEWQPTDAQPLAMTKKHGWSSLKSTDWLALGKQGQPCEITPRDCDPALDHVPDLCDMLSYIESQIPDLVYWLASLQKKCSLRFKTQVS